MTNRLELDWKLDGFVDEQRYYCSETPIDPQNLPLPKAVLGGDVRNYADLAIEKGRKYYLVVSSVKNGVEKLSEIVEELAGIAWTPLNLTVAPTLFLNTDSIVVDSLNRIERVNNIGSLGGVYTQSDNTRKPILSGQSILLSRAPIKKLIGDVSRDPFRNKSVVWAFFVINPTSQHTAEQAVFVGTTSATSAYISRVGFSILPNSNNLRCLYRNTDSGSSYSFTMPIEFNKTQMLFMCFDLVKQKKYTCKYGGVLNQSTTLAGGFTSNTLSRGISVGAGVDESVLVPIEGEINSIIAGDALLTQSEIDKIFGCLAHKYSLTDNLPTNHPYKILVPTI